MQITGRQRGGRRATAVMAVIVVGALLAALGTAALRWAPWERDEPAPGPVAAGPTRHSPGPDPAETLLREGLGGLAGLVIGDDPQLQACAHRDRPAPEPTDPAPTDPEAAADPAAAVAAEAAVDTVTAQVEALRELALTDPPTVRLLPGTEMTTQVTEAFGDQWSEQRIDLETRVLTALGVIAPGTDLGELRVSAFARQVSGYYLSGEEIIGVRVGKPGVMSPLERVVLAHELEHALSAAHLGRPAGDRDDGEAENTDAGRARSAVVEGSAMVTMLQYATVALTPAEQATLRDELRGRAEQRGLAGYSPYLRAELQFPYVAGLRYLCQRWLDGGWAAVADAYRDPPPSTAAVLFPERHDERPREPAALGEPGDGWQHSHTGSFGAAELEWLLAAPGGDPAAAPDHPRRRVAAWDGGQLTAWTSGTDTAVGLALVDRAAGPPLCDTMREWYAAAFPGASVARDGARTEFAAAGQRAVLTCPGRQVRLGIAPSTAAAAAITDR